MNQIINTDSKNSKEPQQSSFWKSMKDVVFFRMPVMTARAVWSGSTLFAILSAPFGRIYIL